MSKIPLGFLKCFGRFIYYWFKVPMGDSVSGHQYEESDSGIYCLECGRNADKLTILEKIVRFKETFKRSD